ncbi:MAG: VWA domain-containing protein [Planctomycetes bacterium]|nr:VWA domain-containing protein [Planctomycetota bacterium]
MKPFRPVAIALLCGASFSVGWGAQDGYRPPILPHPPIRSPFPPSPPFPAVSLESMRATVRLVDGVASTEIEQVFRNHGPVSAEEDYLFPLPDDAVASDLSLWIDGRETRGELLDRDRARQIYEGIVRRNRDPALLEWVGRGCVRVAAFPVPAGGEAKVRLRYTNLLPTSAGVFEYRLPLNLAAIARGGLRSLLVDASIESSRPLAAIYSPTHALDVRREGDRRARALLEATNVAADRDFRLLVAPADKEFGFVFLPNRREGEAGTFVALIAPRFDLEAGKVLPKDLVMVIDTSGSMAGEKIEQAKGAFRQALGRLRPGDRFNLIRFSSEAEAFREAPVEASPENLEAARAWVGRIEARGGTNIDEGLARALQAGRSEGRVPLLFFVTDGLPTVGVTDEKAILANARSRNGAGARIFVFGVGNDVNTRLLDTLAEETRAAREYVRAGEDIEVKVSSLVDKVASPVLSEVSVVFEGAEAHDLYPRQMPDLFKGSSLVLVGRYRGEGRKTARLSGRFADARREWVYEIDLPRVESRNDSIRQLWASRKVYYLLDDLRMNGESREVVEEIRRLGREHGIVTPYTSYLVVEEAQRLASARGLAPGQARFADLDGDGRVDLPAEIRRAFDESGAGAATADGFLRLEKEEGDRAQGSAARLRALGYVTSGGEAVSGSDDVFKSKMAPAPGPATPGPSAPGLYAMARAGGAGVKDDALTAAFVRRAAGRAFHLVGSVWVDSAFTEKDRERVKKVAFLSEEYFALLAKEPGLAAAFAIGERVLVEWKGTFYEVN